MGRMHACDQVAITWEGFWLEFEKKYILNVVRDQKAARFVQLRQGYMPISEHKAKFTELSRYAS